MADRIEQDGDLTTIQIDYEPGTPDPGRVFRAMAGLIEAVHAIERDLAQSISISIEPQLILERVEAGSIRAVLRTLIQQIPDDALQNLEWRPLIGQYLVKGKHAFAEWLDKHPDIDERREILGLQHDLRELAPMATAELLPPAPIPVGNLLVDIAFVARAVAQLQQGDRVKLIAGGAQTPIPTEVRITNDQIEALLTESVQRTTSDNVHLLVKKPAFLGNSKWEFKHGEKPIEAKMLDHQWLERFRSGEVQLIPGDALKVALWTVVSRGFEGQEVATDYSVLHVREVIRSTLQDQESLLDE